MTEIGYRMQTPIKEVKGARATNKIVSILNNSKKEQPQQQISFSFRADHNEAIKPHNSDVEKWQENHKKDRNEYTERKIKLVSASPFQKTEKKKYLKLLSPYTPKKQEGDDLQSLIADESSHKIQQENGLEEVRASLNYFDNQLNQMNDQLQGIVEVADMSIEQEQRIIMHSQRSSNHDFHQKENKEKENEQEQTHKIKRKIVLSHNYRSKQEDQTIKESFRYCIGCLHPILQANIKSHEKQCSHFQTVFQMNYSQIADLLKNMISNLGERIDHIKEALTQQDLNNLKLCTQGLLYESELIAQTGQKSRSFNMKLQTLHEISSKWVIFAQQICKLNWFITLRQNIKQNHLNGTQ